MVKEEHNDKIAEQMRKHRKEPPVFDKWYNELISEIEDSSEEYEDSFSRYKQVMKDSDSILKLTKDKLDDGKKKKNTSFNTDNIKVWIEEALVRKGIISNEKSYSHKPHLASLPYDHSRSRTLEQLVERHNAINDRMKDLRKERNKLVKQSEVNSEKYREEKKERDELIDQYEKMKKEGVRNLDDVYRLEDEISIVQEQIDDTLKERKKISKEIKKWDRIAEDYFNNQRKIKWTALKNGLLDDTMSPEELERAKKFMKERGL